MYVTLCYLIIVSIIVDLIQIHFQGPGKTPQNNTKRDVISRKNTITTNDFNNKSLGLCIYHYVSRIEYLILRKHHKIK